MHLFANFVVNELLVLFPVSGLYTCRLAADWLLPFWFDCLLIPATITVFINGVPMEVPRGPIDLRAMFGQDVMLVHSTGALLPVNDYGILIQSLQMGESYFLVTIHLQASLVSSSLPISQCSFLFMKAPHL